jgi:hypothetical protein
MEGKKDMTDRGRMTFISLFLLPASLVLLPGTGQLNSQEAWERGQIVDQNSGQCLVVRGGSSDNGAAVIQWPCNPKDEHQRWHMRRSGEIVNTFSGKCLGIGGGSVETGKAVVQWECIGHQDQRWQMRGSGEIVNRNSGKCMGVTGGSAQNGAAVVQWDCNGHPDQRWFVRMP